jgi:predicted enzyme related to lactoylglutathione lyase
MPNRLGCSHVPFTVDDIEKACDLIKEMGGEIITPPHRIT